MTLCAISSGGRPSIHPIVTVVHSVAIHSTDYAFPFLSNGRSRRYDGAGCRGPEPITPYQIQGVARLCASSGRELRPGERFYTVLLEEAGQFVRKDYANDAWPGTPEGAIAYWQGRIPASGQPQRPTINDEWLADCFAHLGEAKEPAQKNFATQSATYPRRRASRSLGESFLVGFSVST